LKIFIPFLLLSVTYGLWFVTQKLFNDQYRTNIFGYTCIDQVLAPIYMFVFTAIVDSVGPFKRTCVDEHDQQESWWEAVKGTFSSFTQNKGRAFFTLFAYRGLINARAMAYFYLSVVYNLSVVYLELTLVRIVLSWMITLVVCILVPHFIDLTRVERNTIFAPLNVMLKVLGTVCILIALIILNGAT